MGTGTPMRRDGKRDETAHRTIGQAQESSKGYEAQPERVAQRAAQNKLRNEHGLVKGDGKEVSHKVAAANGGGHTKDNTFVQSRVRNRKNGTKTQTA
jgi:hypothetical protein